MFLELQFPRSRGWDCGDWQKALQRRPVAHDRRRLTGNKGIERKQMGLVEVVTGVMAQQFAASNRLRDQPAVAVLGPSPQLRPRGVRPIGAASGGALCVWLPRSGFAARRRRGGEGRCRLPGLRAGHAAARGSAATRFAGAEAQWRRALNSAARGGQGSINGWVKQPCGQARGSARQEVLKPLPPAFEICETARGFQSRAFCQSAILLSQRLVGPRLGDGSEESRLFSGPRLFGPPLPSGLRTGRAIIASLTYGRLSCASNRRRRCARRGLRLLQITATSRIRHCATANRYALPVGRPWPSGQSGNDSRKQVAGACISL